MKQEKKFSFKMQTNITPYKNWIILVKTLKHSEKYGHKTGQIILY